MRSLCVGAGSTSLNSWPRADTPANRPERYSFCSGVNPADWMGSGKVGFISIHVALVAFVGFQFCNAGFRFVRVFATDGFDDFVQSRIHILRHAVRVAADVEMRARFEPRPQFAGVCQHPVLDVNFLLLIARKREVEAREETGLLPRSELSFVKKIGGAFLVAEEEPVFSLCADGLALFKKCAERRDAKYPRPRVPRAIASTPLLAPARATRRVRWRAPAWQRRRAIRARVCECRTGA